VKDSACASRILGGLCRGAQKICQMYIVKSEQFIHVSLNVVFCTLAHIVIFREVELINMYMKSI